MRAGQGRQGPHDRAHNRGKLGCRLLEVVPGPGQMVREGYPPQLRGTRRASAPAPVNLGRREFNPGPGHQQVPGGRGRELEIRTNAAHPARAHLETGRAIGPQRTGSSPNNRSVSRKAPEPRQCPKRRCTIRRPARKPGSRREVLLQVKVRTGGNSRAPAQLGRGPQYEIGTAKSLHGSGLRTRYGQSEVGGWRRRNPVADINESESRINRVVARTCASEHVEVKVYLGRCRLHRRDAANVQISCSSNAPAP